MIAERQRAERLTWAVAVVTAAAYAAVLLVIGGPWEAAAGVAVQAAFVAPGVAILARVLAPGTRWLPLVTFGPVWVWPRAA